MTDEHIAEGIETGAEPQVEADPLVPAELVPKPEQPARLPRQPWWKIVAVVVAGIAVVVGIAAGMIALFGSFGSANHAEVEVGYHIARAQISGDLALLQRSIPAATVAAIPPARWAAAASSLQRPTTSWGPAAWSDDTLTIPFVYQGTNRTLIVEPQGQDPLLVTLTIPQPGGGVNLGSVRLVKEGQTYKAVSLRLGNQTFSYSPADIQHTLGQ